MNARLALSFALFCALGNIESNMHDLKQFLSESNYLLIRHGLDIRI